MTMNASLYAYLVGTSAITALIGTRIYPVDEVPQNEPLPYIVYEVVSNIPYHLMSADADVYSPRYAIHIFANTNLEIDNIEAAIKTALQDYRGTMNGTTVQRIMYENAFNGAYQSELKIRHRIIDFNIHHE